MGRSPQRPPGTRLLLPLALRLRSASRLRSAAARPFKRFYLVVESGSLSLYRSSNDYHSGRSAIEAFELGCMRGAWLEVVAADASAVATLERAEEL